MGLGLRIWKDWKAMTTHDILELSRLTPEGIAFLADSFGIDTADKKKQQLIYEILDKQQSNVNQSIEWKPFKLQFSFLKWIWHLLIFSAVVEDYHWVS